ncbi:hypothetical protein HY382_00965 [Candidatus Curtissbacteria bacterium]|nr:hypothetical protein [Candidatus Curtissbacteria bacterium]
MVEQATPPEKSVEAEWEAARGFLAQNRVEGAGRLLELRDQDEDRWSIKLGGRKLTLTEEYWPNFESMKVIFQLRRDSSGVDAICGWVYPTDTGKSFRRQTNIIPNVDGLEEQDGSVKILGTDQSDEVPCRVSIRIDDHSYFTSADLIEEAEESVV